MAMVSLLWLPSLVHHPLLTTRIRSTLMDHHRLEKSFPRMDLCSYRREASLRGQIDTGRTSIPWRWSVLVKNVSL